MPILFIIFHIPHITGPLPDILKNGLPVVVAAVLYKTGQKDVEQQPRDQGKPQPAQQEEEHGHLGLDLVLLYMTSISTLKCGEWAKS